MSTIDSAKLDAFLGKFVGDLGAALHAATIVVGDRLGLFKKLAEGPATSVELAARAGLNERLVREWLAAQAASGYAEYDDTTEQYSLTPEQAFALADDDGLHLPGGFLVARSVMNDVDALERAFHSGRGLPWHEHHHDLFHGTERFFRPNYVANLVSSWIPSLDRIGEQLEAGAAVADVGCGHGVSTVVMAQAFPRSRFVGYDYHEASIVHARALAERSGVTDRVRFEVAPATAFPGGDYALVAFFDCLHDMGDPVGVARHVRSSLRDDGAWMIVEPRAEDDIRANLNPVGRVFYSASTMICTPASQSQDVGLALGAQAGEKRLREVITAGGFTHVRRAAETPFNLVLEARL